MFVDFLYELRQRKVPVGTQEAVALGARARGRACTTARSTASTTWRARCWCTREAHLDAFDQAFLAHFQRRRDGGRRSSPQELLDWLKDARRRRADAHARGARRCSRSSTSRSCEQLLRGAAAASRRSATTAATAGSAPAAPRPSATAALQPATASASGGRRRQGQARCRRRRAQVQGLPQTTWCSTSARSRWRCASCAPSPARARATSSTSTSTIDATAKNAGELEVVTRPPRRPNTRVILMMDVGGSMDPYARAGVAALQRREAGHALQGAAHLLLPQLRLRPRLQDAPACRTPVRGAGAARTSAASTTSSIMVGDALMAPVRAGGARRRAGLDRSGGRGGPRLADAAGGALRAQRLAQPGDPALLVRHHRGDPPGLLHVPAHAGGTGRSGEPPDQGPDAQGRPAVEVTRGGVSAG